MTPDNLRKLSWRMFQATIFCGIVGILIIIAVPNTSFRDATDPAVRVIASVGFGLVGITILTNLLSLIIGGIAWFKGTKRCGWIIICTILLLIPIALLAASWLNL